MLYNFCSYLDKNYLGFRCQMIKTEKKNIKDNDALTLIEIREKVHTNII